MSWVVITLNQARYLAFAFEDGASGAMAKGGPVRGPQPTLAEVREAVESPSFTARMANVTATPVDAEWIRYLGLPPSPPWLSAASAPSASPPAPAPAPQPIAPSPEPGRPWLRDPALVGHFHRDQPDDIEATFILLKNKTLERMWVRLETAIPGVGYGAQLLNTSRHSPVLAAGAKLMVRPSRSHPPLMWLPTPAAKNLGQWDVLCQSCGLDLLFIEVEELARMQFPNAPPGAVPTKFTTRCVLCQQTMTVDRRG